MSEVGWLEQTDADVPTSAEWLTPGEAVRLETFRFPKRRSDWRLGRWTAKCAVARYLGGGYPLGGIEIRAAPCGAPEAWLTDRPASVRISLSHRAGVACCAVTAAGNALGCDLELVEPRSDAFLADYFTAQEQDFVSSAPAVHRFAATALLWSAKESALKALRVGLRSDPRSVVTAIPSSFPIDPTGWLSLLVRYGDREFHGWWREGQLFPVHSAECIPCGITLVRTMLAAPPAGLPKALV